MRRFSKLVTTGPAAGEGAMEEEKEEEETLGKGGRVVVVVVGREREEDEMTRCDEDEAAVFFGNRCCCCCCSSPWRLLNEGYKSLDAPGATIREEGRAMGKKARCWRRKKMCKVSRG
jgi:hypothetical protein